MSSDRQRLSARDYKHAKRGEGGGFDISQYRQFGAGLAAGLAVALGVWLYDHRAGAAEAALVEGEPQPRTAASETDETPADAPGPTEQPTAADLDFYDMLPAFEVEVAGKTGGTRPPAAPAQPVQKPGAYIIQAGSYRNQADAERLRSKLAKLGIDASVQHTDSFHRVRIGPFRDLNKLDATRRELRAADIDSLVMRLGD